MESTRWSLVQNLFHEALSLPESERTAFLASACGEDLALIHEVAAMLTADSQGSSLLDRGLPDIAYRTVGNGTGSIPSQEFGPYRLRRILGEGGMGVVWLAERSDVGNLVAIKFLPHAGFTPARRERFAREIRTLAKLNHPLIARLYDAGTLADGTPWFVMEYVEGVRLTEYCRAQGRTVEEQLRTFRSVCEAVLYAHGQEIIHRDLKPSNILIAKDGEPRLLDFGIARELNQLDDSGEQTRPGLRFLSPDYAAPEWAHEGVVGLYTDVYSLGVVFYEILAGRLPFERSTPSINGSEERSLGHHVDRPSVVARRLSGLERTTNPAARLSKSAWADLDVLCLKAMHQDAKERYPSVEALLRDVNHFLNKEPLEARADTLRYRVGKFVRRHRAAVLAVSVTLILLVCMASLFTYRLTRARRTALAEAARTERIQRFMLNLLGDWDQEAAPSGDLRVITLLDRGVKDADSLDPDPATQTELYETLGIMYDRLGKFEKADKLLSSALDKAKIAFGPESPKVAELLVAMGALRGDQSQIGAAEQLTSQGVELATRRLQPNDPVLLGAKEALGRVLVEGGFYEKAIAQLEPIAQLKPSGESVYAVRDGLSDLAVAEQDTQHYDAALSMGLRAIAMDRQLLGESHPQTAFDLMNLGSAQANLAEYPDAERNYREALDILKNWYGADHPDTATSMAILARTLDVEGKNSEAEAVLKQVLDVQERNYGKVHERIAFTLDTMGRIAVKRQDLASAQADFSRALAIDQTLFGNGNYQTAAIQSDLGDLYIRKSQFVLAETTLHAAVAAFQALPGLNPLTGLAQARLGRALLDLKRFSDAEKQLIEARQSMEKMHIPPAGQLREVRLDLVRLYQELDQPQNVKKIEAELTAGNSKETKLAGAK
jgi:serine/threonine protein kinase